MKKLLPIVSILMLLLVLSQCRKPVFPDFGYKDVTLTVENGGGEKGSFVADGTTAISYQWNSNDKIYVYGSTATCATDHMTTDFTDGEFCGVLDFAGYGKDNSDNDVLTKAKFFGTKIKIRNDMKTFRFVHYGSSVTKNQETGEATVSFASQDGTSLTWLSNNVVALYDDEINNECVYNNCKLKVQFAVANFSFVNFFPSTAKEGGVNFMMYGAELNTTISVSTNGVMSYSDIAPVVLSDVEKNIKYYVALVPKVIGGSDDPIGVVFRGNGYKTATGGTIVIKPNKYYHGNNSEGTVVIEGSIIPDTNSDGSGSAGSFNYGPWGSINP